jgi:hypothetical protein
VAALQIRKPLKSAALFPDVASWKLAVRNGRLLW